MQRTTPMDTYCAIREGVLEQIGDSIPRAVALILVVVETCDLDKNVLTVSSSMVSREGYAALARMVAVNARENIRDALRGPTDGA